MNSWGHLLVCREVSQARVFSMEEYHITQQDVHHRPWSDEIQNTYASRGIHMWNRQNNTLPISKTGKEKRNISVEEVLCLHVPTVNIYGWIRKRSNVLQFEHFCVSTRWISFKSKLSLLLCWEDLSKRILSHWFWKSSHALMIWYTLACLYCHDHNRLHTNDVITIRHTMSYCNIQTWSLL